MPRKYTPIERNGFPSTPKLVETPDDRIQTDYLTGQPSDSWKKKPIQQDLFSEGETSSNPPKSLPNDRKKSNKAFWARKNARKRW